MISYLNNIFKIIRWKNLAIISLSQIFIKFFFIDFFIQKDQLLNENFVILLIVTILIAASGYIVNDIYDYNLDQINKPERVVLGKFLKSRDAIIIYMLFNSLAIVLSIFLCIKIKQEIYILVFLLIIYCLWLYSKKLKKYKIIGNILIAFFISLSILNVPLFSYKNILSDDRFFVFLIISIYSVLAFLINVKREIIKDIEDIEGDKMHKVKSLPIIFGTKKSKLVTVIIGIILMFAISSIITFQILILRSDLLLDVGGNQFSNPQIWGANYISTVYMFIILIIFFYAELLILNATSKTNFTKVSKLLKFLMLLSLLSIPVFSLTHFYV
jgi:4-hydroxybenzoate polyprenyltransferase|tara:strand:- start:295 stop:1278 length:984 start_codon:yes stop_codon:yes gene_type:complete